MTPYRMLSIQIAASRRGFTPDPRLVEEAALWTGEEFAGKARLIERLARLTETIGPLNSHLYAGVRRRSALKPADLQRHIPKLQALAGKAAALAAYATMVTNYFGLPSDPTLAGVKTLIAIFRAISYLPPGAENIAAAIAMHPSRTKPSRRHSVRHEMAGTASTLSPHIPSGGLGRPRWRASRAACPRRAVLARPGRQSLPEIGSCARKPVVGAVAEAAGRTARPPRRGSGEPSVAPQICRRGRAPGDTSKRCLARKKGSPSPDSRGCQDSRGTRRLRPESQCRACHRRGPRRHRRRHIAIISKPASTRSSTPSPLR